MNKLRKNKIVVLTICVIVVSIAYFCIQKAIDNYAFKNNSDIVVEEDILQEEADGTGVEQSSDSRDGDGSVDDAGAFAQEETDLVLEEAEVSREGAVASSDDGENNDMEVGSETDESEAVELEEEKIYVYITGEVNSPGVVILNEGSRIVDAINAAGGTTIKADVSKVNLVYVLEDGMKVNIPNDKDLKNNPNFEYITMNSGDGRNDDYLSNNENSGGEVNSSSSNASSSNSESYKSYSIVNINTATQTELETLPGIGPSLALKIINYRKENGKFSSIEEIKNVSGIGESKFTELKNYITV